MAPSFEEIDRLKSEWDTLQPLAAEDNRRLWQKLRLEWNYHSNHIEGNTLTYGETALLLLHGQTHGDHSLREYEEMKAHDVGIEHIRHLAADRDRLIGETDIRDLNRIILKEPFWKPTRTADGQPTRSMVYPGEYKTLPNSVITASGELFEYARPIDVPEKMRALVEWLGLSLREESLHAIQIAAKFHHDFVLIHPFDDGNGRVARMLVNYLLLREGYPPLIVPTGEKNAYLASLRLADAGDLSPLADFLGTQLGRSLKLAIKAAKGESIEEPSDIEKQVAIFVRGERARSSNLEGATKEILNELGEISFYPFISELERKFEGLKPLFADYKVRTFNTGANEAVQEKVAKVKLRPGGEFLMRFCFLGYKGAAPVSFNHETVIGLHFPPGRYTITFNGEVLASKPYTEPLLNEEIDRITASILAKDFEVIRAKATQRA